jgi:hypothetical protein
MQRGFAPEWAGGWNVARWAFTFTLFYAHLPRLARIEDAYACTDMVFSTGPWRLAEYVIWTPQSATGMWWLGIVGLAGMAWGGRLFRVGLLLHLIGAWALLTEEALNLKAHDRLAPTSMALPQSGDRPWRVGSSSWSSAGSTGRPGR